MFFLFSNENNKIQKPKLYPTPTYTKMLNNFFPDFLVQIDLCCIFAFLHRSLLYDEPEKICFFQEKELIKMILFKKQPF